uniref:Uncharacterized protein n=1 Tax=Anopheles dirus TaxID=7168 RepID=A0A182NKL0_9DIPT
MPLPSYLDFSANIRTHGAFLTLDAIATLLMRAAWNFKKEDLPKELEHIGHMKETLLILGIAEVLFAVIFWIGFLKPIRWFLTLIIAYVAVLMILNIIVLILSLANTFIFWWMVIEFVKCIHYAKEVLLLLGIMASLFATIFWIGFLKGKRWCLTAILGYMAVGLVLQIVGLVKFVSPTNMFIVSWIVIWFGK